MAIAKEQNIMLEIIGLILFSIACGAIALLIVAIGQGWL